MSTVLLATISFSLALVFMIMWIRARRASRRAEIVAYGLRAQDDHDENTKTNLTIMDAEFQVAIQKLAQLGQVKRDNWGRWVWVDSGQAIGQ